MSHPFLYLQARKDLADCCRNMLNLNVQQTQPGVLKAHCLKCGRGHIKMKAEGFAFKNLLGAESWQKNRG